MRKICSMLAAALAMVLLSTAPVAAQEADDSSIGLQFWAPYTAAWDSTSARESPQTFSDVVTQFSFGPVISFSSEHSVGIHANFLSVFDDDLEPQATLAYAYTQGSLSVGGGVTIDRDGRVDNPFGVLVGYNNMAFWLNQQGILFGVAVPIS